jgi:hypothetical protein
VERGDARSREPADHRRALAARWIERNIHVEFGGRPRTGLVPGRHPDHRDGLRDERAVRRRNFFLEAFREVRQTLKGVAREKEDEREERSVGDFMAETIQRFPDVPRP